MAQVPGDKEELKKQLMNGAANGISSQQIESLKKELEEQENLIAGYQQENQRLYDQVKALQKKAKVTEERMFTENQRLQTELTNIRSGAKMSMAKKSVAKMSGAKKSRAKMSVAKKSEAKMSEAKKSEALKSEGGTSESQMMSLIFYATVALFHSLKKILQVV